MEFDELLITTGVDALVRLVKEKKKIELAVAAQLLDIPRETLEEWGRVLEEEGIIRIEYSLTKIFFVWVEPTPEEIAAEKEEFYGQKESLEEEIKTLKTKLEPEMKNIEAMKSEFSQLYDKLYPKLVSLEETLTSITQKKDAKTSDYFKRVEDIQTKISDLDADLKEIKNELAEVGRELASEPRIELVDQEKFENMRKEFDALRKELENLREEAKEIPHMIPTEMPAVSDIKRKFNSTKAEFEKLKKLVIALREDFQNLKETSALLSSIGSSITKYENEISSANIEVEKLAKTLAEIKNRANALAEKVKEETEILDRFSDSLGVAKSVLTKFPSQDEFLAKLDDVSSKSKELEEKIRVMETLLSSFSVPTNIITKFEDINAQINVKLAEMEKEAEALSKAVDEESTTYETFQKIKERAVSSLASYSNKLKAIEEEITKLKSESAVVAQQLSKELERYSKKLSQKDIQETLKLAEDLKKKKEILDNISASINSLSEDADSINKRLTLLAKEAAMLEIRASSMPAEAYTRAKGEIRHRLTLTKDEEREFEKKREELRELIKKLWEEG